MRIGVSYNVFDGQELLPYSIQTLREQVDYINIVYQLVSNRGHKADDDLENLLQSLVEQKWVDEIRHYEPNLYLHPHLNAIAKRDVGLQLAKKAGCTHFMSLDVDEFYRPEQFRAAWTFLRNSDIGCSAVPIVSYIREPIYQIVRPAPAYVPFICRIEKTSCYQFRNVFPVKVDVTRRLNGHRKFHLFEASEIAMHHMWLVRRDLDKKFQNSSDTADQLRKRMHDWTFGKQFRHEDEAEPMEVIRVANTFKIDLSRAPLVVKSAPKRRTVLLTNHHLETLAGSEMTTLEMARVFEGMGFEVHVATLRYGARVQKLFRQHRIKVFDVLNAALPRTDYDVAWCHHSPVLTRVIDQGVRIKKVVLRTLSPIEPMEAFPFYVNDVDIALATSPGTAQRYYGQGWIDKEKVRIFPNSVPPEFFKEAKPRSTSTLRRIAIVSNHVPSELQEAARLLKDKSIRVDVIGQGGIEEPVTPAVLEPYDLVVTIGKTVQYCFALRVPVYCYDHFGGHGYLTDANFDEAEYYTFSGRCSNRQLTADELLADIIEGYPNALQRLDQLRVVAEERYDLEKNMRQILEELDADNSYSNVFYHKRFSKELTMQLVHNEYYCTLLNQYLTQTAQLELRGYSTALGRFANGKRWLFRRVLKKIAKRLGIVS